MQNKKFNQLKDKGNRGENFFVQRHNELIAHPVMLIQDMTDWGVEGSDLTGERLMWKKALVKDLEGIDRDGISPYFEYGGIEVKTLSHDQFLPRFGVDDLPCGTLGFPLWEKTEDLSEDRTGYLRGAHGNLRRWMEPSVDNRSSKPMLLVHLLYTEDIDVESNKANERPFAAIIFEDVEALLGRIIDHLLPYDLNLKDWNSIPVDQKAKELQIPGLYLQGNMVHIPLTVIGDLATVTMIGEDPVIYDTGRCKASVQYERLNYLKALAGGRWIPQEKPETDILDDSELKDMWHKKMLLGYPRFQGLLDKAGKPIDI